MRVNREEVVAVLELNSVKKAPLMEEIEWRPALSLTDPELEEDEVQVAC